MSFQKAIILCMSILLLSACATSSVSTNNTAFFNETFIPSGSISVLAASKDFKTSLEFATYKRKFEDQLAINGYRIEADSSKAESIALIAFGIDEGQTETITNPIYGQIGYSTGGLRSTRIGVRTTYMMPSYGVAGSSRHSVTIYNHAIAMDIVDGESFREGNPVKLYEARTTSTGSCSVIVEVFDEMLTAMFEGFPGENGRNRKMKVPGEFNC